MEKHNNKLALALLMFCMILIGMLSMPNVQAASKIKLNKTSVTLEKGKSVTLKLKGAKKKVTWSSNKKKVATVTKKGKVTAKKVGTAKITAKVGNQKYICKVKVVKAKTQPQATPTDATWQVGEERTIGNFVFRMYSDGVGVRRYVGTETNVTIPLEADGYLVTIITDCVFKDNSTLVSVVMPEGITKINGDVCRNCPKLTRVVIPLSVTKIEDGSFMQCPNLIVSVYDNSYAKSYMLEWSIPMEII